jgi:hypothetical protein
MPSDSSLVDAEHPLYRMWKDRLDAELVREAAWVQRKAERERELADWYEAWHIYKARLGEVRTRVPLPRWWNLLGWLRWLMRLHAPGRHH